jgi:hypothetical protein
MTREIPQREWRQFFESFTMQHDGWLVHVDGRDDVEAPLEGITTSDDGIVITTGRDIHFHQRTVVHDPKRVVVQSDGGVDRGLAIEGDDGITRVRFRSPMPPELVDGMV